MTQQRGTQIVIAVLAAIGVVGLNGWREARSALRGERAEVARLGAELSAAGQATVRWQALHERANAALAECVDNWDAATRAAAAAARDAQAARQALQRQQAEWEAQWNRRSDQCGTALVSMRDACAADIGSF